MLSRLQGVVGDQLMFQLFVRHGSGVVLVLLKK